MTHPIDALHVLPLEGRPANVESDGVSIGQILSVLTRRWLALTSTILGIAMVGLLIVKMLTPSYTSTAIIVLSARQDSVVDMQQAYMNSATSDAMTRSESDALQSRTLVDRVVDRENLIADPEFNLFIRPPVKNLLTRSGLTKYLPKAVQVRFGFIPPNPTGLSADQIKYNVATQVLNSYAVAADPKTYTVKVSFTSVDAVKASRIANRFAAEYMASQVDERVAASDRAAIWLNPHLVELSKKVEQADRAVEDFRQAHHIVDLPGAQGDNNTLALQEVQNLAQGLSTARNTRAQLEAAQQEVAQLRDDPERALSAPAVAAAPVVENLRVQELTAAAQLASLKGTYGERHPLVVSATNALQELRTRLTEEASRALSQLDVQMHAAQTNEAQLQTRMNELTSVRSAETRVLPQLRQLESEQTAAKTVYDTFVQGLLRATSQDGVPVPKGRIIQHADTVDWPTFPNVPIAMAIILVAGAMIGVGVVYALEAADKSFRSADEIEENIRLPVLGLTLLAPRNMARKRGRVSHNVVTEPVSALSETVRQVRTAITFSRGDRQPKVVMVTSAVPGEGKTTFALMMARQSALAGNRVIVVEAEMRKPTFDKDLDPMPAKGLGHYLLNRATLDEIVGIDSTSGVHFIAARERSALSGELLASPKMTTLLRELGTRYDFIVLDTPPVTIVADALQLGAVIDAAVLVVKWNSTPRYLVGDAAKKLRAANVPVVGAVMTQVDARRYKFYGQGALPYEYAKAYYTQA
ncbi:MAG TPA: polysaccharide biosynthesis tyrosine autokinase [Micropepsaceae bacterium]|nr:polysaccharide biosynthesis tyrosine autokinase [Micropepsaceae bacterium]